MFEATNSQSWRHLCFMRFPFDTFSPTRMRFAIDFCPHRQKSISFLFSVGVGYFQLRGLAKQPLIFFPSHLLLMRLCVSNGTKLRFSKWGSCGWYSVDGRYFVRWGEMGSIREFLNIGKDNRQLGRELIKKGLGRNEPFILLDNAGAPKIRG